MKNKIKPSSKAATPLTELENNQVPSSVQDIAKQLALITDTAPVFIAHCDVEGRYLFVNKPYAERLGLKPEDCIGKKIHEVVGDEAFESFRQYFEKVLKGERVEFEVEVPYSVIGKHYMYCSYAPEFDASGKVVGMVAAISDITERKRRELNAEFLGAISENLANLSNVNQIMRLVADRVGRYLNVSGCQFIQVDLAKDEVTVLYDWHSSEGNSITGVHKISDFVDDEIKTTMASNKPFVVEDIENDDRLANRDGFRALNLRSFISYPYLMQGEWKASLGVHQSTPRKWTSLEIEFVRDLTTRVWTRIERARTEEALRESEERFQMLANGSPVLIWVNNLDGCEFVNRAYLDFLGVKQEVDVRGYDWSNFVHPEDRDQYLSAYMKAFEEKDYFQAEFRFQRQDGQYRWMRSVANPRRGPDGIFMGYVGASIDITERKLAEERLREAEERMRLALQVGAGGTWDIDFVLGKTYWSETHFLLLGYQPDPTGLADPEMWRRVVHEDDLKFVLDEWKRAEKTGTEYHAEHRIRRADSGEIRWLDAVGRFFYGPDGKVVRFIGVFFDVTSRKQAENRLTLISEVSDLARTITDANELLYEVSKAVGIHLQVSRCLFNEIDIEQDREVVHRDFCNGLPSVAGIHKISEYSPVTSAEIQTGKTIVNFDSKIDPRTSRDYDRSYGPNQERAYVAVPLFRENRWIATLWVSDNQPRIWTPQEVSLLENIAERTWAVVEKLRIDSELHESQQEFEALVWTSAQIVWETNVDGAAEKDSPTWRQFTGQTFEERKGFGWLNVIHPDDRERVNRKWRETVQAKRALEIEYRLRHKSGLWRWTISRATPLFDDDGNVRKWVGMNTDFTERKLTEESLLISRKQLQTALNSAEEASRLKDEFLATLSHELRTPLNAILGWAHMLQTKSVSSGLASSALTAIYSSAKNQAQIIDDLLDVSRIISGKMNIQPEKVVLADLLSAATNTMIHAINAKNIQLDLTFAKGAEKISLYADSQKLQQVFWNLLSNAVKFTPNDGKIEIKIEKTNQDVTIRFQDSGVGIKPEFLPFVFERFRQADSSTTRKYGGLGLGLSIAKHLVEMHGGTVSVESAGDGAGAVFVVRLPLGHPPASSDFSLSQSEILDRERVSHKAEFPGKRILLIDDDINTLNLIREVFIQSGAEVKTTTSAAQGLDILKKFNPDLLISDIAMPDHDGYWFIRQMRSLPDVKNIPSIALSAYASSEDQAKAIDSGFQMFVSKPIEPEGLMDLAKVLLEKSSKEKNSNEGSFPNRSLGKRDRSILNSKKILLIEDDLLSTEVFREALEREGVEFRSAPRASKALEILRDWLPDLIISDLGLPDQDGFELIKKIRALPSVQHASIPAIALTGYGKEEGDRAIKSGFQLYKSKPIDPDTLISVLIDLIRK